MMNFTVIGIVVLLVHDPSDVLLIAGRAYTDLRNKKLPVTLAIYAISYPVWIYTRNYVLPTCVLPATFEMLAKPISEDLDIIFYLPMVYMVIMLTALAIMHVYWSYFITKAAVTMIVKGKDKNGYDS